MPKRLEISNDPTKVTVDKAAEMLNKSSHCVRQLIARKALVSERLGHTVLVDVDSILTYYAKKKGLPSWESNIDKVRNRSFIAISGAASALMVQEPYIIRLLKSKTLEGYVTVFGDVMISRDSINSYLKTPLSDRDESAAADL